MTDLNNTPKVFGGSYVTELPARPHRARGVTPPMDPAYATYRGIAVARATQYADDAGFRPGALDVVVISVAAAPGTSLVLSTKAVIDGIKEAGIIRDDKCDCLPWFIVQRHDPAIYSGSVVWLNELNPRWEACSFLVDALPAVPLYLPARTQVPKFNGSANTPTKYQDQLLSDDLNPYGDASILDSPPRGCSVFVWMNPKTPVDPDNVCLGVLGHLEMLRGAENRAFLLDEIVEHVEVIYDQNCTSGEVKFEFHTP